MAPKIDEVDVFTIPHCRMKQLVQSCTEKSIITDFTNRDALLMLLNSLCNVFKEFKSHEEIENEHIMRKLKMKLKEMKIHNSAVCNCHSNDQFSPLIDLVDSGYIYTNKQKAASDKLNFGIKLRKALKDFAKEFLPHMKEEEEVFQPLLVKYFDEKELIEMKSLVIKLHILQRKQNNEDNRKVIIDDCQFDNQTTNINKLPNELILKIFSYLQQKELLNSAKVSKNWNNLAFDPLKWNKLSFSEWTSNELKVNDQINFEYKDVDYIDDSDEEFDAMNAISIKEVKMLHFWVKNLLPRVGSYINHLDISNCKSINNNLARRIFQLCPNLKILNVSYSTVGDNAFKGVTLKRLEHVNFEACEKITDTAFKYLIDESINSMKRPFNDKIRGVYINERTNEVFDEHYQHNCKYSRCKMCMKYSISVNIEEFKLRQFKLHHDSTKQNTEIKPKLNYLNLSGCYSVTDLGLKYLLMKFDLQNLKYLNLSGCPNLSSIDLNQFVNLCINLRAENVFYCDNVMNGPFDGQANGCENLECSEKFCCRNNEYLKFEYK